MVAMSLTHKPGYLSPIVVVSVFVVKVVFAVLIDKFVIAVIIIVYIAIIVELVGTLLDSQQF